MGLEINYFEGQTPLDEDEREGLLIPGISTRQELDEHEQQNIEQAIRWTFERRKKFTREEILSVEFICDLHSRMLGNVWQWAGKFRSTNKNIGVDKFSIRLDLNILLDDVRFWINHKTFPADEIALRFKHRLVSIHCFPNGNGRHSRLVADIVIEKIFGSAVFTWGSINLIHQTEFRSLYLKALRSADIGNFDQLLIFSRS
ncbi:mobile mystery protein B [Chitinophaga sp. sic0106]|uniref:mobile mystery protein B n=1 Tax=Chitinophaga sp. sic0106 TaxID=2854785 RepID=UPI001C46302B|nr:mobile mystery protein B [Chitinophaga sp. sic0106]MBV7533973.1 mobile mystery protein B [Chitinophaga sp. sic0106]